MDAVTNAIKVPAWLLIVSFAVVLALPQGDCFGGNEYNCGRHHEPYFDGSVLAAWSRTWHGPNALTTPLTPYYIPRIAPCSYGCGDFAGRANGCGGAIGEYYFEEGADRYESNDSDHELRENYGYQCTEGGFERLGKIPNEIGIAGQLPPGAVVVPAP